MLTDYPDQALLDNLELNLKRNVGVKDGQTHVEVSLDALTVDTHLTLHISGVYLGPVC